MLSESNESRKFERPKMFDEPLPVRSGPKEVASSSADIEESASTLSNTMAFSLMTKKGNKQQVCHATCDLLNCSMNALNLI